MGIIVGGGDKKTSKLPLVSLNHVSFACNSVTEFARFYEDALGFVLIKCPSFNFEGAWLFNCGIGIHLLESAENSQATKGRINPKDNHISFQCSDMKLVTQKDTVCQWWKKVAFKLINFSFMTQMATWLRFAIVKISLFFQFPPAIETQSQTKTGRLECNAQAKLLLQHR